MLSVRHRRFVEEYLKDLNAAAAARRSGYAEATSNREGHRLLSRADVQEAVTKAREAISNENKLTIQMIEDELRTIAFANMKNYLKATEEGEPALHFGGLSSDQTAALSEVTIDTYTEGRGDDARTVKRVKFKLHDKKGALTDLLKHKGGMFNAKFNPNREDADDDDDTAQTPDLIIKGGLPR